MYKPIRLIIADHDIKFALGLESFLAQQKNIKVINIVRDGHGAVNACQELLPDIVLMDLRLPVLDSIRAIRSIITQNELIKVLVFSSTPNDRYAIEAIKAGACGYIENKGGESCQDILSAINQVVTGEVVLNSSLASHILHEFS